jgi:hypothetical protein
VLLSTAYFPYLGKIAVSAGQSELLNAECRAEYSKKGVRDSYEMCE